MIKRLAVLATILMFASACDKANGSARAPETAAHRSVPRGRGLDLASHPPLLFHVFGDADDPRMIPIAALVGGRIEAIVLSRDGWRSLDSAYLRAGLSYTLYRDGHVRGEARVTRGMWEGAGAPFYTLARCRTLTPMAAVSLAGASRGDLTAEFLASNARLGRARSEARLPAAATARAAREIAHAVGTAAELSKATLDSLDFRALAIPPGVHERPTLIASLIDPSSESTTRRRAAHLFAIAEWDSSAGRYRPSFTHRVNGQLDRAEFRRYVDHLDLTGDGIDEIIVEGWQVGGDTFLLVLSYQDGAWRERFRSRPNWCLDASVSDE